MGIIRPLNKPDLTTVNQALADHGAEALKALSQRELDSLGLPLAYVDRQQRYRLANSAFLDWIGKSGEDCGKVVAHRDSQPTAAFHD